MASSEQGEWEQLPEELMPMVLDRLASTSVVAYR